MNATPNSSGVPVLDLKTFVTVVGEVNRWRMLCELSRGEPREIDELARAAGCSYPAAARHAMRLYRAGLLIRGRGRLYQLAPQYLPSANQPMMDFGHCLIRPKVGS